MKITGSGGKKKRTLRVCVSATKMKTFRRQKLQIKVHLIVNFININFNINIITFFK